MLNRAIDQPFAEVQQFGAVIKRVDNHQLHVGFLYKIGSDPPQMVHLAWHHVLRHSTPVRRLSLGPSGLNVVVRTVIASAVTEIAEDQNLPYSPMFQGVYFDSATLRYHRTGHGDGLTCATFMVAILDAWVFRYLSSRNGRLDRKDAEWTEKIISMLEDTPTALPEHIQVIR